VVIIAYAGAQRGSGGTVTTSGGNTIHTFTASGTYTG
jgi:PKD repeat protein